MDTIETVYGEAEILETVETKHELPTPHTFKEFRVRLATGEEKWIDEGDLMLHEGWDDHLF